MRLRKAAIDAGKRLYTADSRFTELGSGYLSWEAALRAGKPLPGGGKRLYALGSRYTRREANFSRRKAAIRGR